MNLEEMSKEELIDYINNLDENNNGKYSLRWDNEKEPETIVEECNKKIPVLKEIESKMVDNGGENNILIEGDNWHALSCLNYTHAGEINVIYIDPPYNTGNQDFVYNDKYVDSEDGYRHSKWLNFLHKRLKIARDLLSNSGSIFISIDDNEQAQLKLLCDKVFDEKNYIGTFVINATPNGRDYGMIAKQHEYCLCYAKDKSQVYSRKIKDKEKKFKYQDDLGGFNIHPLYNSNVAFTPENRPNLYYPFYVDPKNKIGDDFYEISLEKKDGYVEVFPPISVKGDAQFVWRWGKEKSKQNINKEILGYKVGEEFRIVQKMRHSEKLIRSLLLDKEFSTRKGTEELEKILGKKTFPYPKPTALIKRLIESSCPEGGIVLDFFAGTGTTGQAVLELNKEDGFDRRFILCTNNENNICNESTFPRLKTVITGYREDGSKYSDGLEGTLKYYKTEFVENNVTKDQLFYDMTEECIPMLCIKEDTFDEIEKNDEYVIYTNKEKDKYTCVYFDSMNRKYDEFMNKLKDIQARKIIYIFTLGNMIEDQELDEVKNYKIEAIPQKIYNLYKKLVKKSKEE